MACKAVENDVWVAVVDGRPVGFLALRFIDEDASRAGEIYMIAVDPFHQRAGIGTAPMQHALSEIEARGVSLAVVATGDDPGHEPSRALYEKPIEPTSFPQRVPWVLAVIATPVR